MVFGKLVSRVREGLKKTSKALESNLGGLFSGKVDAATCEALEDALLMADMGAEVAMSLAEKLRASKLGRDITELEARRWLAGEIGGLLSPCEVPLSLPADKKPAVLLMVGVNGAGKTTTIGKLAARYKGEGKKVMLAAGDTFRAGAVEQLKRWAERANVPIVTPHKEGADPAGLIFSAVESAEAEGVDVLICDTAGRLQNRKDLMEQLAKIIRVLRKKDGTAPHATLLTLDATVGQNAYSQVEAFREISGVTGLMVTKLDSTAKGGVVVGLAKKFGLPVHFIGVGEKIEDLRPFSAKTYANALLDLPENDLGEDVAS